MQKSAYLPEALVGQGSPQGTVAAISQLLLSRLACLDQSSLIFSVVREPSSIFPGTWRLFFLSQVILAPCSPPGYGPRPRACLSWPSAWSAWLPLLPQSIAGLCCPLCLAWDDLAYLMWVGDLF